MSMHDSSESARRPPSGRRASLPAALLSIALLLVYARHFAVIWTTAFDLPHWDEWHALPPERFSWSWLFSFHNEHRMVTARLLIWLLYRINGWDVAINQVTAFVLFGVLVGAVALASWRWSPPRARFVVGAFAFFLLSPLIWDSHTIALQFAWHGALLLLVAGCALLFSSVQRTGRLLAGTLCLLLAVYSFGAAIAGALAVLVCFAAFELSRGRRTGGAARRGQLARLAAVLVPVSLGIGIWFVGFPGQTTGGGLTLPHEPGFWKHFLALLALGFGAEERRPLLGAAWLAAVLAPHVVIFALRRRPAVDDWRLLACVAVALSLLAMTSLGRAATGEWVTRYAELSMLLVPFTGAAAARALNGWRFSRPALLAFWLTVAAGYADNWSFEPYQVFKVRSVLGLQCVASWYQQGGEARCPTLQNDPLADELARARELRLSFHRKLERHGAWRAFAYAEDDAAGRRRVFACAEGPAAFVLRGRSLPDGARVRDCVRVDR